MPIAITLALVLMQPLAWQQPTKVVELNNPDGGDPRCQYQLPGERMPVAKVSPKQGWEFEWCVPGLCRVEAWQGKWYSRFRVFEQQRKEVGDVAEQTARMLLRLWDLNYRRLLIDHNPGLNYGLVDVYLCFGGKAGGEQILDEDKQELTDQKTPKKVNTIYIYAIQSFTDPVEMAREVAHEYGHATLPAIGGFESPEDWANGKLGEKLFLKWLRDLMAVNQLGANDAMGAEFSDVDRWVKANVDPLIQQAALNGPDVALMSKKGQKAMDAYLGLAMFAESLLPTSVFTRSMKLTGSALEFPKNIVLAASEPDSYIMSVPKSLVGKPIWIPLGKGKLNGNADGPLKRNGDWALVKPGDTGFRVVNRAKSQ